MDAVPTENVSQVARASYRTERRVGRSDSRDQRNRGSGSGDGPVHAYFGALASWKRNRALEKTEYCAESRYHSPGRFGRPEPAVRQGGGGSSAERVCAAAEGSEPRVGLRGAAGQ